MSNPSTLFPRSYIIERIKARIASIDSRLPEIDDLVRQHNALTIDPLLGYFAAASEWAAGAKKAADRARRHVNDGDPVKAVQSFDAAMSRMRSDGRYRNELPAYPKGSDLLAPDGSNPGGSQSEEQKALGVTGHRVARRDLLAEKDSLEHALAYLEGTPVEAFSMTSLQRLGLLDAVKFDLGAARASAKGRRR